MSLITRPCERGSAQSEEARNTEVLIRKEMRLHQDFRIVELLPLGNSTGHGAIVTPYHRISNPTERGMRSTFFGYSVDFR
jgi:hypothetical protein